MKVGDLVYFKSGFQPFNSQYVRKNPGVVLHVTPSPHSRNTIQVFWSDGTTTNEFEGYVNLYKMMQTQC